MHSTHITSRHIDTIIESSYFHFASPGLIYFYFTLLTDDVLSLYSQSSWRKYHDDDTKTDYYYDHTSGESRWDLPEGEILVDDDDDDDDDDENEVVEFNETDDLYVSSEVSQSSHLLCFCNYSHDLILIV